MGLQQLLFGNTTPVFGWEWAAANFSFHPAHSNLAYAMQPGKGGTRAILAAVQAHIITYLLFTRDTERTQLERLCRVGRREQGQALATALAETLWAAGGGDRAVVCLITAPVTTTPPEGFRASSFTERIRLFEFSEKAAAQEFISDHINCLLGCRSCSPPQLAGKGKSRALAELPTALVESLSPEGFKSCADVAFGNLAVASAVLRLDL
ncbi:hypothetical protein TURU_009346 [Turdus rufiventris]|nr:hypothetical protein TURU_009346 [Turdus rufiventris]